MKQLNLNIERILEKGQEMEEFYSVWGPFCDNICRMNSEFKKILELSQTL